MTQDQAENVSGARKLVEDIARLASFPQTGPNPILEIDRSGAVIFYNPATLTALENLGLPPDAGVFVPPDLGNMLQALARGEQANLYREMALNGATFGEDIQILPQFDTLRIYAHDISKRKRTEETLRESEAMLRSLSDNLPNCMLYQIVRTHDGRRRFTFVSEAVRRFYNCSPDEARADANRIYGQVVEDDRQRVWEEEEAALKAFSIFNTEVRIKNPAGGVRWSHFASTPRRLEDGSTCWDGIEVDITERKQAEEQLQHLAEQRAWLVRDSYHRVKNNLMVVEILLGMQADEFQDPHMLEVIKESQTRVRSMLLIHEQLHHSPDLMHVDFSAYLHELAHTLFNTYRTQVIPIKLVVEMQDIFLGADTAMSCGLILNELISNALKHAFIGRERGRLSIAMRQAGDHYTLAVSDDGVGLPAGEDWRNQGSLGARIVQAQVRSLRGKIELEHSAGTTWKITFTRPG